MFFCLFFCFQPILSSAVISTTICMKCFYSDEALVVFILHVNSLGHLYTIVFLWKWKPPLLSLWRGWVRTKRVFNSIITFFFFKSLLFTSSFWTFLLSTFYCFLLILLYSEQCVCMLMSEALRSAGSSSDNGASFFKKSIKIMKKKDDGSDVCFFSLLPFFVLYFYTV